jgi:hypothetical protein
MTSAAEQPEPSGRLGWKMRAGGPLNGRAYGLLLDASYALIEKEAAVRQDENGNEA